jgi:hypothetical protein
MKVAQVHPVNLDHLEEEIRRTPVPETDYTPLPRRELAPVLDHTALQIIAHGITRLTWKDAENMGTSIQTKLKDGASLTSAIQAWAEGWESFQ